MTLAQHLEAVISDYDARMAEYRGLMVQVQDAVVRLTAEREMLDAMYAEMAECNRLMKANQAYAAETLEHVRELDDEGEWWKTGNGGNSDA